MANNAIGIKFEVEGGGSISSGSGQLIKEQLSKIVATLNEAPFKIRLTIDSNYFQKEIANLKETIANIQSELGSVGNDGKGGGSGGDKYSTSFKQAEAAAKRYFSVLKNIQALSTRSTAVIENKDGSFSLNEEAEESKRSVEKIKAVYKEYERAKQEKDATKASYLESGDQQKYNKMYDSLQSNYNVESTAKTAQAEASWNKLVMKVGDYAERNREAASRTREGRNALKELQELAKNGDYRSFDKLNKKLSDTDKLLNQNNLKTKTWFQKFKDVFSNRVKSALSFAIIGAVTRQLRQVYTNVVEIDSAMTQLKIVTGESEASFKKFSDTVSASAKKIGASITDLIKSTTTYARLGFSLEDSAKYAELTSMYSKVANVDVSEATSNITAIIKAFDIPADQLESVLDKMTWVGNSYAISSSEIGEAMNNAASSLVANGNTLEEALGIVTAANTTLQDVSKASTAVRTIAARISRSTTELNEIGEDVTGISTAKLAKEMKIFGIEITNSNGELRSTYDILNDIADKWDNFNSVERASIANALSGTRQQNAFYSIIQNWQDAESVVAGASNAVGTLSQKNAEYVDSIQGRLAILNASWQEFSKNILDSDLVKNAIKFINGIVKALNWLTTFLDGAVLKIGAISAATAVFVKVLKMARESAFIELLKDAVTKWFPRYIKGAGAAAAATKTLAAAGKGAVVGGAAEVSTEGGSTAAAGGVAVASKAGTAGAVGLGVVIGSIIGTTILGIVDKIRNKKYDNASSILSEVTNEKTKTEQEISSLKELEKRLQEAKGNREALVSIYDELNQKIGVSSKLIDGESKAYASANAKLEDQINLKERLLKKQQEDEAETALSVATTHLLKASAFGIDALHPDYTYQDAVKWATYYESWKDIDATNAEKEIKTDKAGEFLRNIGISQSDWNSYWDEQADYAITAYQSFIDEYSGFIEDKDTLSLLIKEAVRTGTVEIGTEGFDKFLSDLNDSGLKILIDQFYEALSDDSSEAVSTYYEAISRSLDILIDKYPALTELIKECKKTLFDRSTEGAGNIYQAFYETISLSEFFDKYQEPFDLLLDSLEEMEEYGDLSASTIKSLIDSGIDLGDSFGKSAEECIVATDALQNYTKALLDEAIAAVAAAQSTDDLNTAYQNVQNLITTLTILNKTYQRNNKKKALEDEKEALNAQKDALDKQKDSLNEQLDAYQELIELRKELVQSYQEELEYQRELERKQQNLAKLQSRLATARLDTSAAGKNRAKSIEEEVTTAREELSDYTLEHAVDMLVDELEGQYTEYKNMIDAELEAIDAQTNSIQDTISSLDTTPEVYVDTSSIANILAEAKAELESTYAEANQHLAIIEQNTALNQGGTQRRIYQSTMSGMGGYNPTTNGGLTESEFYRSSAMVKQYGSYQNYVEELKKKYPYISPNTATTGRYGTPYTIGIYHSGGIVGDEELKNNEEFAKLMKGEYVATPQQMQNFLNNTLPEIANSANNSSNTFNSPLVEIHCDSVTQEALPKLKDIVDEAVTKIQKKLDEGFSRSSYKPSAKKLLI